MSAPAAPGSRLFALGLVVVMALAPAVGISASVAQVASGVGAAPALFLSGPAASSTSSTNWAGWAVTGPTHSVSKVTASWIEPKIQGRCPSTGQYASFWVGIDGYSSPTVEQLGTDSDCSGGSPSYYAWYELYPAGSHLISSLTISPGDVISASVSFAGGKFTLKLTDVTTGHSFSKTAKRSADRTSAEWIAEAPYSNRILPLADFGVVDFGRSYTGVATTDNATISGTSGTIGSFSNAVSITMVTARGSATKATPSALSGSGSSFNVTWVSAGP